MIIEDITGQEIQEENSLKECKLDKLEWKTKEGQLIKVCDMEDTHLRSIAMFLAGFGYKKCYAPDILKIAWLAVLRTEWERRERARANNMKIWKVR